MTASHRQVYPHPLQLPDDFNFEELFAHAYTACESAVPEALAHEGKSERNPHPPLDPSVTLDAGPQPPRKKARTESPPTQAPSSSAKLAKQHRKRDKKAAERWKTHGHLARESTKKSHIGGASAPIVTPLGIEKLPIKVGAYSALGGKIPDAHEVMSLDAALKRGFTLVPWEGFIDRPVQEKNGRVIVSLVGRPQDPSYKESMDQAFTKMMEEGDKAQFTLHELHHKRGSGFAAINVGLSYGNGHQAPSRYKLGRREELVEALLADPDIQRLAAYQDASFALWHPKGYKYYKENLDKLWANHPELDQPNFPRSTLPTVAFNIGRNVWTFKHLDPQNCPFGWCCITALGNFNSKTGGHLILWELGLIIEFPAGACICIPSAIITHSNIPVTKGESRASFTQYCSGEIFRYIENGFLTDTDLKTKNPDQLAQNQKMRQTRLRKGFGMFSTIKELLKGVYYR